MAFMTFLLGFLSLFLFYLACRRGDGSHKKGLLAGVKLLYSFLPLLILAFLAAGLLQVVLPGHLVSSWLGPESGGRGIFIGSIAGALIPGGPYIAFPLIASIHRSGAGLGTVVALIVSWSMLTPTKLPFELALLGPRFTAARLSLVIFMAPLAGYLAQLLFTKI